MDRPRMYALIMLLMVAGARIGLLAQDSSPQRPASASVGATEGQSKLQSAARWAWIASKKGSGWRYTAVNPASVHVESEELDLDTEESGPQHYRFPLKDVALLQGHCFALSAYCCTLKPLDDENGKEITVRDDKALPGLLVFGFASKHPYCSNVTDPAARRECSQAAGRFASALNAITHPSGENVHQQAAAWRALAVKPPLPDEVRVRSLLAEEAVRNKKPLEALKYYQQGLDLYALWPQGWFNAALISAELGRYVSAIDLMQNYLLLEPDAPDAPQTRDQLEMWKIKVKEK